MQGLADGYFILPYTIGGFLAESRHEAVKPDHPACAAVEAEVKQLMDRLLAGSGKRTADYFHRALGKIVWESCGMSRNAAGLESAIGQIAELREQFWRDLLVPGSAADFNQALEAAGRTADFFELGELMCRDALLRDESCGAHFREEHQTDEGEASRDDARFSNVAVWQYAGEGNTPGRYEEPLTFEYVKPAQRSYK
jgi:succinate dehydrogenase / fumarate reductase flavoprotein subunit